MKKQKSLLKVQGKDGSDITVEGDRMGPFIVHQVPGSNFWSVTHERSGIAVVQSIKGVLRARKMAAALLSYDLSDELRVADRADQLGAACRADPFLWAVLTEFNNKAANSQYDPSVLERKAIQMPLFGGL